MPCACLARLFRILCRHIRRTPKHGHPNVRTHVVATTSSEGMTVVTANQTSAASAPIVQHPLQQQAYEDAQFSSQEAPPSYTAATAFPTYTGPPPQVYNVLVVVSSYPIHARSIDLCLIAFLLSLAHPQQRGLLYV